MTRLGLKLGFDNYSIRALNWKAPQLLEYAASLGVDAVLFSDLDVYETFSDAYLLDVRRKAADLGIEIHVGTGGICKASEFWNGKWGSPEKLLRTTIRVARALASPVARCYLGWVGDRKPKVGLAPHIRNVVKTCRALRSFALDSGVKIAVENHAGDMQSHELLGLIHDAGPEYVGATMDSGNAVWTLEDPLDTLEQLGPVAVCTGIRDSCVWETPRGAAFEWKAMGDGDVDWKAYFARYARICPKTPVQLEIITGPARDLPYLKPEFWQTRPDAPAPGLARYAAWARRNRAPTPYRTPKGLKAEQEWQKLQLERSIRICRKTYGLGLK